MSAAFGPLLSALVVISLTSEVFAQGVDSAVNTDVGRAYRFAGFTKYVTIPSKFLFGDERLLRSDIVDGYRIDLNAGDRNCLEEVREAVILTKVQREWWAQPTYVMADPNESDELEEVIVILSPDSGNLAENLCLRSIPPEEFLVDENISRELQN